MSDPLVGYPVRDGSSARYYGYDLDAWYIAARKSNCEENGLHCMIRMDLLNPGSESVLLSRELAV